MREPHQLASHNRAIRWVGDTITLFYGSFDISYFLFLLVVSVFEDIHSRMGGSDVVPLYYSCQ